MLCNLSVYCCLVIHVMFEAEVLVCSFSFTIYVPRVYRWGKFKLRADHVVVVLYSG